MNQRFSKRELSEIWDWLGWCMVEIGSKSLEDEIFALRSKIEEALNDGEAIAFEISPVYQELIE